MEALEGLDPLDEAKKWLSYRLFESVSANIGTAAGDIRLLQLVRLIGSWGIFDLKSGSEG